MTRGKIKPATEREEDIIRNTREGFLVTKNGKGSKDRLHIPREENRDEAYCKSRGINKREVDLKWKSKKIYPKGFNQPICKDCIDIWRKKT